MTKNLAHRIVYSLMAISLLAVVFGLVGCATPSQTGLAQIATQYAVAKTIEESDTITSDGVIRYVELARDLIDQDVVLDPAKVADSILNELEGTHLSPADRVLAVALVMQIQAQFEELDLLDPPTRVTLLQVLGWIEQAARLSGR